MYVYVYILCTYTHIYIHIKRYQWNVRVFSQRVSFIIIIKTLSTIIYIYSNGMRLNPSVGRFWLLYIDDECMNNDYFSSF